MEDHIAVYQYKNLVYRRYRFVFMIIPVIQITTPKHINNQDIESKEKNKNNKNTQQQKNKNIGSPSLMGKLEQKVVEAVVSYRGRVK